jgi:hypothetical protein
MSCLAKPSGNKGVRVGVGEAFALAKASTLADTCPYRATF